MGIRILCLIPVHSGFEYRIIAPIPAHRRMNSEDIPTEVSMFLNEFKYVSVLNNCFRMNSNLYTVRFVHGSLSSWNISKVF